MNLTPRQRQVAALVAQGFTDKRIAGTLGVTRPVVTGHIVAIACVLHLDHERNTRVQLALWWRDHTETKAAG